MVGVGTGWSLIRSLPSQTTVWFCDYLMTLSLLVYCHPPCSPLFDWLCDCFQVFPGLGHDAGFKLPSAGIYAQLSTEADSGRSHEPLTPHVCVGSNIRAVGRKVSKRSQLILKWVPCSALPLSVHEWPGRMNPSALKGVICLWDFPVGKHKYDMLLMAMS